MRQIQKILLLGSMIVAAALYGQTITTGDLTGTVADASGAVVPGANVTLKSLDTGESETARSGSNGEYRFNLLKPGAYQLSAASTGMKSNACSVNVSLGEVVTADLTLRVEEPKQTVLVTEAAPLVETDNANLVTTFSARQIADLPAPGGDITTAAFTVPGIVMNTGGGFGNFSSHGLPATSNLFTLNGNDYTDSFLSVNNAGASNLTLGLNEIAEASVVQNGYSVEYGRNAGAQINYITKSGANEFHGNLLYDWNGSALNANDFFNDLYGLDKPRAVSNSYAASIGGPIKKNKLFFYTDVEGLRYVLPTSGVVAYPSPQFQSYILGNISPVSLPIYKAAFSEFSGAKGQPVTTGDAGTQDASGTLGCGDFAGTPAAGGGTFGVDVPCAYSYATNGSNQNREWLMTDRVDWNINAAEKIFFRYKVDHGFQPTGTNLVDPAFNVQSVQPQDEGQINLTSTISPSMVNSFVGSVLWYSSTFNAPDLSQAVQKLPVDLDIMGAGGSNGGSWYPIGFGYSPFPGYDMGFNMFPQGRNVGQLGLVDDLSKIVGKHNLKAGINFKKSQITDFVLNENLYGTYRFFTVADFANGVTDPDTGSRYQQAFAPASNTHLRFYDIGFYAQDEWSVKDNLKITYGLRLERAGDPSCLERCFSMLNTPFSTLGSGATLDTPYNQSISTNLSNGYPSVAALTPLPRLGVAWRPWKRSSNSTVIRAGIGLFADAAPGSLLENLITNQPYLFTSKVFSGAPAGLSTDAGTAAASALAQYNAFKTGFANGASFNQLNDSIPGGFSPISFFSVPNHLNGPEYLEWSFEIEQPIGAKNVLAATYAGNHGYNLLVENPFANVSVNTDNFPNGFGGLPLSAPDPRFNAVTQVMDHGVSNYDSLTIQFRRGFAYGFQGQIGYTWSHALDDLSNPPGEPYNFYTSMIALANPDLKANYSNSDFDIRHSLVADFVWDSPWKPSLRALRWVASNWTVSSKLYLRSGAPFSVIDSALPGEISNAFPGTIMMTAQAAGGGIPKNCGSGAVDTPCFAASDFVAAGSETGFGLPRNSFYGPGYFNIDTAVYKNFPIGERARFSLGAQFYNILNHPNFASPSNDVNGNALGQIFGDVSAPASPYGSFQGAAVSGRVITLSGRVNF